MVLVVEDTIRSPPNRKDPFPKQEVAGNEPLFSPGFRSAAHMAGWDEEALLIATLVVEDTPERESKHKKRSDLSHFKTPPTNSRRKRRAQRNSPVLLPVTTLNLDLDQVPNKESEKKESKAEADTKKKTIKDESDGVKESTKEDSDSSCSAIPCIDRLREELSCAICLEICFEPSTTPCGHSFCKKCLRSAADKCGKKCPKCRQLISNGRSCTVNTVLWNTIQLLFPQEVEARKTAAAGALNSREVERRRQSPPRASHYNARNRSVLALNSPESEERRPGRRYSNRQRRRELVASQDEDAAMALRLQREEFMEAFRGGGGSSDEQHRRSSLAFATANLRAMASRAMYSRIRGRESRA